MRDLRARLGLDSGHLARQLRRLEDDGLVTMAPDPARTGGVGPSG